jgi:hypothetical protein
MPGINFESSFNKPKGPEQPGREAPPTPVDQMAQQRAAREKAFNRSVLVAAGKIQEMAVHWGLRGGDMTKNDVAELTAAIGQLNVGDKEEFLRRVSANIDSLPESSPQLQRQKTLSKTLLQRLMGEMFVNLDEDEDLPAVTGTAI